MSMSNDVTRTVVQFCKSNGLGQPEAARLLFNLRTDLEWDYDHDDSGDELREYCSIVVAAAWLEG